MIVRSIDGYRAAVLAAFFAALMTCAGCSVWKSQGFTPQSLPAQYAAERRTDKVLIDYRVLTVPAPEEHLVGAEDVLGIYIADILGDREELPAVNYPGFRANSGPPVPYVGQPVKVERDGTIALPMIDPLPVQGLTIPQIRELIRTEYVDQRGLVERGRESILVTLIASRSIKINVFRQDTRYNTPGLQNTAQFELSRKWSGTTVVIEPSEATVLNVLNKTGGLPGIDAMNEVWVMKGVGPGEIGNAIDPVIEKMTGEFPIMLPKKNSKLIRIPLSHNPAEPLPFSPDDVILGDGDVVLLPRRDGDFFMTGGVLPGGRYPLARDRDTDIFEAIAMTTSSAMGPVGQSRAPQFKGSPGGIIPQTDVVVIRQKNEFDQVRICIDLKKAMEGPTERIRIMRGDLIILKYKPHELMANVALNWFNFNINNSWSH